MSATRKMALTGLVLFTGMAMLLALAASSWAQGPPVTGTGTGILVQEPEVLDSREAGNNRIETRELIVELEGALEGTFTQEVRGVVSADGQVRFQGTGEFEGTLEGCGEGTSHFRLNGRGQAGEFPDFPATTVNAAVVDQASSTLPATGRGTFSQTGPFLTYEIQYVCHN